MNDDDFSYFFEQNIFIFNQIQKLFFLLKKENYL